MELRSPDPSLNPYLAFALIISAGLDGIENGAKLPPALDADLYAAGESVTSGLAALPGSLEEAARLARGSALAERTVGRELLGKYCDIKLAEARDFAAAKEKTGFYWERYFKAV
jgi:glutamine synthetase